ncbi:MAG: hypothetical protein M1834_008254 [Cirrosporium novae-zelandiae]|nr:MAG: hypothetical protein M1834_008254 [Cirrosporium novae-zelandiae]
MGRSDTTEGCSSSSSSKVRGGGTIFHEHEHKVSCGIGGAGNFKKITEMNWYDGQYIEHINDIKRRASESMSSKTEQQQDADVATGVVEQQQQQRRRSSLVEKAVGLLHPGRRRESEG